MGPRNSTMPAILPRPSPEIERRLTKLEKGEIAGGGGRTDSPGDAAGSGEYEEDQLYLAYASNIANPSVQGIITNQSDATDFQFAPFAADGTLMDWRGALFSKSYYQSGDATDYTWVDITAEAVNFSFVRYTTTSPRLLVDLGDPDNPGTGVTWDLVADTSLPIADTVFWVAERFTIDGVTSAWAIYPANTKETGFGLISYTITGRNKPVLGDTQWNIDVLVAVSSFTGLTYSSITELGFGTAVGITYDNGTLYGLLKKVSGSPVWVTPTEFIDGALLVDVSIIEDKIADNAITVSKILDGSINTAKIAANAVTVNEILDGSINTAKIAANAVTTAALAANAVTSTEIAANSVTTGKIVANAITASEIAVGTITATEIQANSIGANEIAANAITASEIAVGTITATEIQANAIGANEIAANSITAGEIAANAITTSEIAAGAVTAVEITAGTITTNLIASNAITTDLILADNVTADKMAANSITSGSLVITGPNKIDSSTIGAITTFSQTTAPTAVGVGDIWTDTDDGNKLYRWNGSSWVTVRDTTIADAQTTADSKTLPTEVADAVNNNSTTIIGSKITTGSIAAAQITTGTITANEIAAGTITANEIAAGTITATEIAANAITASSLVITGPGKIDSGIIGAVTTFYQTTAPTAVGVGDLWTDTDDANRLYRWNGSSWVNIQDGAINIAQTTADSKTLPTEVAAAVNNNTTTIIGSKITTGSIAAAQITTGTITANEIAANTITATEIAANTITATQIAAGTITATEIATGTITANEIAAGTITASRITTGTITATQIAAGTIDADNLIVGTLTADETNFDIRHTFTASGSFVVPSGVSSILVTGCGGGGGGGRLPSSSFCTQGFGGSGAGAVVNSEFNVTSGQTITITIGVGGAGHVGGGSGTGSNGTATTFSGAGISTVTLGGGGGGAPGAAGAGGTVSGVIGVTGGLGVVSMGGCAYQTNTAVCINIPANTSKPGYSHFGFGGMGAEDNTALQPSGFGGGGGGSGDWDDSRSGPGSDGFLKFETIRGVHS